jgi:sugar/nucleoside kinase (ribokinase family)
VSGRAGGPAFVVIGDVMTDVAVHSTRDLTHDLARGSDTAADIVIGGGGAGGNVAAWLGHLGADVGLVAAVGDDAAGRLAIEMLERHGVRVHAVRSRSRATGTVVAIGDGGGERTMLTDRGANSGLSAQDLPRDWFRAGAHLHLSGYTLFAEPARAAGRAALRMAAACGMRVSVDPASWAPLRAIGPQRFLQWTAVAGMCLPNAAEARLLAGTSDVQDAARRLGAHYGCAVVTAGADGALWSDGTRVLSVPAPGPVDVASGVGAGDAFTAGYLAAANRGADPAAALAGAARAAAQVLRRPGARPG